MTRSLTLVVAMAALAFPAASHALVSARISGSTLIVDGTVLKDTIVVSPAGSTNLRVSDKERVNGHDGCSQSGGDAICPRAGLTKVVVVAKGSDDSVILQLPSGIVGDVNGNDGNDTVDALLVPAGSVLKGDAGNDALRGGDGPDTLDGGAGNDVLESRKGADKLFGKEGNDSLDGGAGDDQLQGDGGADQLVGGPDADTVQYGASSPVIATIGATTGNGGQAAGDAIDLSVEKLVGNVGADVLTGAGGEDVLEGGAGDDTLRGEGGRDTLRGLRGNDQLFGGSGPDVLLGDRVADAPGDVAPGGNDVIVGGADDDYAEPGFGVDSYDGEGGRDIVAYSLAVDLVIALDQQGASGPPADRSAGGDSISNVEQANGGAGDDVLIGSGGNNRLVGNTGDDVLRGGPNENPDGTDQFDGGPGFDEVSYAARFEGISADADGNADDGVPPQGTNSSEGDRIGTDIEKITGGRGPDVLSATATPNGQTTVPFGVLTATVRTVLDGQDGDDVLTGGALADALLGGAGVDTLNALGGDDVIDASGDAQADAANCGEGVDDTARLDLVDTFTGCEGTLVAAVGRHPTVAFPRALPRLAGRVLSVPLTCPRRAAGACRGTLDVALSSGPALATVRFNVPRGATRALRVRLGRAAARRVARAGRVRLTARERDPEGRPKTATALRRVRR